MNKRSRPYWFLLVALWAAVVLACNGGAPPADSTNATTAAEPSATSAAVEASATTAALPTSQPTASPIPTAGPSCTVLQQLFLRSGPGKAYNPPVGTFPANTVLTPTGYTTAGIPGGSWVQVQDASGQHKGWVSAGSDFVSCTIDLTSLPEVAVAPPPEPPKPRAQGSNPDGTCGAGGADGVNGTYDCQPVIQNGFPVEMKVTKDNAPLEHGVEVDFSVTDDNGTTVYSNSETNAAYCFFGGDGPCGLWVLEDYVYKWESGGAAIEPGHYTVRIEVITDDPGEPLNLNWHEDMQIRLP
ncbi:MAG: SH3 domain-containing protein [Anaerolineae bacterium]